MSAVVLSLRKVGEPITLERIRECARRQQAWIDEQLEQPTCAPGTFDPAMKRIARECGV